MHEIDNNIYIARGAAWSGGGFREEELCNDSSQKGETRKKWLDP